METTEILQRVIALHDLYLDITSQMTKFTREIIEENGGKITLDLDEDGCINDDCDPVIITMWNEKSGEPKNVIVHSVEVNKHGMLVEDSDGDWFDVYPEHIYEILEFIGIWADYQSKIKRS